MALSVSHSLSLFCSFSLSYFVQLWFTSFEWKSQICIKWPNIVNNNTIVVNIDLKCSDTVISCKKIHSQHEYIDAPIQTSSWCSTTRERERKHPFVSNKNEIYTMIKITNSGLVLCVLWEKKTIEFNAQLMWWKL